MRPIEKKEFKRGVRNFSALIAIFLVFCVSLSAVMLTTTGGSAIGWGLSIGVPLVLGFYAGLFAFIGQTEPLDPKASGCDGFRIVKYIIGLCLFIVLAIFGFFFIDGLVKGTGIFKSLGTAFSGLYCIVMAILVFVLPLTVGVSMAVICGKKVRRWILNKHTVDVKKLTLLLILGLFFPPTLDLIEAKLGYNKNLGIERVILTDQVKASVPELFKNIEYFMDHTEMPSLVYKLGFPKLIKTVGKIEKVGDEVLCVFDRGHIIKRVSRLYHHPNESLIQFDVIEQKNIEDRSVDLVRGTFKLVKVNSQHTELTLNAVYKPKLTPRWMWQPLETFTVKALHNHVLKSVEQNIEYRKLKWSVND